MPGLFHWYQVEWGYEHTRISIIRNSLETAKENKPYAKANKPYCAKKVEGIR
jgi:hypothetical protein